MSAMFDPAHPGEIVREAIDTVGWSVREAAHRLGVPRSTLRRVLDCRSGVSARLALALEDMGWSSADFWMRLQDQYALAKVRREKGAAGRESFGGG